MGKGEERGREESREKGLGREGKERVRTGRVKERRGEGRRGKRKEVGEEGTPIISL